MDEAERVSFNSMKISDSSIGSRISDGCIEELLRNSDTIAALPIPREDSAGGEDGDDWVDLSGDGPGRAGLAPPAIKPESSAGGSGGHPDALVCAFEKHHSSVAGRKSNVRLQTRPFSRVKWVELIQPPPPMCERCTSTVRKHWMGQTTSPVLCMAFCQYTARIQCRSQRCTEWVSGAECIRLNDLMCAMCKADQQAQNLQAEQQKARLEAQQQADVEARQAELAAAATLRVNDYTPVEPPTHYVFLYGDAQQYIATLHEKIENDGSFPFWEACAGESPGHVFALSSAQLTQLHALFTGEAVRTVRFRSHLILSLQFRLEPVLVRTAANHLAMIVGTAEQAVTAIIYTADGDAESLACTTYVVAETRQSPDPGGADAVGTGGGAAAPLISGSADAESAR